MKVFLNRNSFRAAPATGAARRGRKELIKTIRAPLGWTDAKLEQASDRDVWTRSEECSPRRRDQRGECPERKPSEKEEARPQGTEKDEEINLTREQDVRRPLKPGLY